LYFVVGFPTILIGPVNGMLIDAFGGTRTLIYYNLVEQLGLVFIVIGAWNTSFASLLIGRFFLGIGISGVKISALIGIKYWFPNNFASA